MSRLLLIFALWCVAVVFALTGAAWAGWDPFADGGGHHQGPAERSHHHGGGGYWGFSHK